MERKLQKQLKEYFEAPEPIRKREFMRKVGRQNMSMAHMMKTQLCYISKCAWIASFFLFMFALFLNYHIESTYIGSVNALVPFFVMVSITESMRSYHYGMDELELSSRFSLKSIILTRMIILGISNFMMILFIALLSGYNVYSQLVYMMVPYLITAIGGLMIVRKVSNRDGTYLCFSFSVLVAFLVIVVSMKYNFIYNTSYLGIWTVVCVCFMVLMIREIHRTIRKTEDLAWN
ncbi:hypothetical protein [Anaerosporobacter sp.]